MFTVSVLVASQCVFFSVLKVVFRLSHGNLIVCKSFCGGLCEGPPDGNIRVVLGDQHQSAHARALRNLGNQGSASFD